MHSEEHEKIFRVVENFNQAKALLESMGITFPEAIEAFYQFNGNSTNVTEHLLSRRSQHSPYSSTSWEFIEADSSMQSLEGEFKKCVFSLLVLREFLNPTHLEYNDLRDTLLMQYRSGIMGYILLMLLELEHTTARDLEFSIASEGGLEWGQQSTLAARISKGVTYYGAYLKYGISYVVPGSRFLFSGVSAISNLLRTRAQHDFKFGVERGWGPRELRSMTSPLPSGQVRVTCIRHGMGYHNDVMGAFSFLNRDAQLNEVGVNQAQTLVLLRARGLLDRKGQLLVISPFIRTLSTAVQLFGQKQWAVPTVISPLCAEHTFSRSHIQQGDRGSTVQELRMEFSDYDYPQFRAFFDVAEYARHKNCVNGQWWHHGHEEQCETEESFAARLLEFRQWLCGECARVGYSHVIVVTHGGFLYRTLDVKLSNCEFTSFNMNLADASINFDCRPPAHVELKKLVLFSAELAGYYYPFDPAIEVKGLVNDVHFTFSKPLSAFKEQLHQPIIDHCSREVYEQSFSSKFPANVFYCNKMLDWLEILCGLIETGALPPMVEAQILGFFELGNGQNGLASSTI